MSDDSRFSVNVEYVSRIKETPENTHFFSHITFGEEKKLMSL